jgi:hypothetical protein
MVEMSRLDIFHQILKRKFLRIIEKIDSLVRKNNSSFWRQY